MKSGPFENTSPIAKLFILGILIIVSGLIFSALGLLLSSVLWGESGIQTALDLVGNKNINALKLLQIMQSIGIFILPAIAAAYLFSPNPWKFLGFNKTKGTIIGKTFIIVLVSLPAINLLASINELFPLSQWMIDMEEKAEQLTKAFLVTNSFGAFMVNILMVAILPAIGEELVFRGILQRGLIKITKSKWFGIILAAALFSFIHFQFKGFIPRFALGVAFGYLLEVTGSLWVPIAAHFFNNAIATIGYMLMGVGVADEKIEDFGGLDQIWPLGVASLVIVIVLLISIKRELIKNGRVLDIGNN
ncbi:CPBP family intramembrane glutamic endopeptidase [Tenuifilum thalassicum]|uniref:CPBP family intramembrane metalloprotease n=1 Tax=Tenuifilum thalassicum TaxID=2590900 RepID=A0A7D3XWZ4_9BACT|nr:type II CAAX endopeptidase family protein [Tenuifilum thalassicum]QKG81068.1 CPBP family intramembrane metalloprotease [Tenuifilum thalassicum]